MTLCCVETESCSVATEKEGFQSSHTEMEYDSVDISKISANVNKNADEKIKFEKTFNMKENERLTAKVGNEARAGRGGGGVEKTRGQRRTGKEGKFGKIDERRNVKDSHALTTEVLEDGEGNTCTDREWKHHELGQCKFSKVMKSKTEPGRKLLLLEHDRVVKKRADITNTTPTLENTTPILIDAEAKDVSVLLKNETWTQTQQKLLEHALNQFPKFSEDRWVHIGMAVPGKSKVQSSWT